MAAISASSATSTMARAALVRKGPIVVSSSPVLGLPQIGMKGGRVRCSAVEEAASEHRKDAGVLSLLAAAAATGVMSMSSPALALVDDRLSTEGTGLPFGLSNNLLGWILFGVFGLIWSFYFIYTSTLEEDEESGLSL